LKALYLEGKVFSGKGEGTKFTTLPWAEKQITQKLGFSPHPGTLNIKLTERSTKLRKQLRKARPVEITPPTGYCKGKCFLAILQNDTECAIVIPETPDYPENIAEAIAPVNLRERLKLKDGDAVQLKITL
jgi:riboflavin kinase